MEDHVPDSHSFRCGPKAGGRFSPVVLLLALWLLGWLAGEALLLWVLLTEMEPATSTVLFFLFWTVSGAWVFRVLLYDQWGEDLLVLRGDQLICTIRSGPFTSVRIFPADQIRSVYVQHWNGVRGKYYFDLVARLPSKVVKLTANGEPHRLIEIAEQLRQALQLPDYFLAAGSNVAGTALELPKAWQLLENTRGEKLLVPNLRHRRRLAWVLAAITAVIGLMALLLILIVLLLDQSLWMPGLIATILAALGLWGTAWLGWGRIEWRITPGYLIRQRRFGRRVTVLCEARALELVEKSSPTWFDLRAIKLSSKTSRRLPKAITITISRAIITKCIDPTVPRQLGLWLAHEARLPFNDRVPSFAERPVLRRSPLVVNRQQG